MKETVRTVCAARWPCLYSSLACTCSFTSGPGERDDP
jgi:hypothetical protein